MLGPFSTSSVNAHSLFVPVKLGQQSADSRIATKPPKPPERPIMPYMRYSRKKWDSVKAQNPDLKMWAIGKIIGHMWRELPDAAKQVYVDEYESEKIEYEKALKAYQCSPQYQAYLQSKAKEKNVSKSSQQDPGVYIQPVEDDDRLSSQLSVKHVAAVRFHRNSRLISEILNSQCVPDLRSVVTTQRMSVLQRQVQSLAMHQKKLENELQGLQNRFVSKRQKLEEFNQSFVERLKKVCEEQPVIEEHSFQCMVDRAKERLLAQYKEYAQKSLNTTSMNKESLSTAILDKVQPTNLAEPTTDHVAPDQNCNQEHSNPPPQHDSVALNMDGTSGWPNADSKRNDLVNIPAIQVATETSENLIEGTSKSDVTTKNDAINSDGDDISMKSIEHDDDADEQGCDFEYDEA